MSDFQLSVVIPVYNEGKQIFNNIMVIHDILNKNDISHDFILVDDGSRDETWAEMKKLGLELNGLKAIRLSRNFGKEAALCAGLEHASGDVCVTMDADLQHPPSLIPKMIEIWENEKCDVVEGVKKARGKESMLNKLGAHVFYKLLNKFSGMDMTNASDFKLMDQKVIQAWRQMGERITFFRGMSAWVGFHRTKIEFIVEDRHEGKSKWSFLRLVGLAMNAITSFTAFPLQLVTFTGVIFLFGAFVMAIQTLYMKIMNIASSGFTTVILLILIVGSILMISLGIIGTYIARIFEEVKFRPRYIISETAGDKQNQNIEN